MYKIVTKKELTPNVKYFEVHAPAVAHKSRPGQFVIVRAEETGERLRRQIRKIKSLTSKPFGVTTKYGILVPSLEVASY